VTRETAIQIACLYGPLSAAALLIWWVRPGKRLATGLLYSTAWVAALLPWLDSAIVAIGLWEYAASEIRIGEIPLALYFGWVIAWGIVAPLLAVALGRRIWFTVAVMTIIDLRIMPEMTPMLSLAGNWWLGETAILALLLIPAMFLALWTQSATRTPIRCAMLAPAFGGIFLGIPLLAISGGMDALIDRWQSFPQTARILFATATAAFSLPGLTALRDFALSGKGTPVPLEPPQHLVTHGIYGYVRNPMQISMSLLLVAESVFLMSFWPVFLAVMGIVYSEGLARWSENQDMRDRFGERWERYRSGHRPWIPRWRPLIDEPCELWFDDHCGVCTEVADWFASRAPEKLILRKASEWEAAPLQRMTWHHPPSGRTESGIAGVAMAFQHLHLGWAALGWIAGIPGISHTIQLCFDTAGAGKKPLESA
jgi:protein-S-isoprenylcysteine O-methyltransferase Ste14